MQNLQKLLQFLVQSPLDFVLIGGFAAVLHGCNQTTRDIDFYPVSINKVPVFKNFSLFVVIWNSTDRLPQIFFRYFYNKTA